MNMAGEFPFLVWQHEYCKKWITYSYEDQYHINNAVEKKKKTITITNSPEKKVIITFDKMLQKNMKSGVQQHMRCLIFNGCYYCWSWQNELGNMISFIPRITFLLEIAYKKKLNNVDYFFKDDCCVDLKTFMLINKETGKSTPISRDKIEVEFTKFKHHEENLITKYKLKCKNLLKMMAAEDIQRIQTIAYDLPPLEPESTEDLPTSFRLSADRNELISTLTPELQASIAMQTDRIVLVDPNCPKAKNYHVYVDSNGPYDATLNLTDLQHNMNKFFTIQLLKDRRKVVYAVWSRWGRVGSEGNTSLEKFGKSFEEAKISFEKKFYEKTKNHWTDKNSFLRHPKGYDLIMTEYNYENPIGTLEGESKLDSRIQALLRLLLNENNWLDLVKDYEIDLKQTPLGYITPAQIIEGYVALNKIANLIANGNKGKDLVQACSDFYTKIPHDFKRKTPTLLSEMKQVNMKIRMLEDLSNIYVAKNVIHSSSNGGENIMDKIYQKLKCTLIPLDYGCEEYQILENCINQMKGPTHTHFSSIELVDVFCCLREMEESCFKNINPKKLLWHGSRITNFISILKKGLRIAPPEAPITGFMFGRGVYFADVYSKSANYCHATPQSNEGCIILCEISLGKQYLASAPHLFTKAPGGFDSVFAMGRIQPKEFKITALSPEATFPAGLQEEDGTMDSMLFYNEYIVYNENQVKLKYLLRVKFRF